jgi:hypothetical protein
MVDSAQSLMEFATRSVIDASRTEARQPLAQGKPADRGADGTGCQPGAELDAPTR